MLNVLLPHNNIEEGARYRRATGGIMTETAEVLEVGRDKMGIPHVRFQLYVACGNTGAAMEQRTLSLDSFHARYRERVN
jgi:hypothetical protein